MPTDYKWSPIKDLPKDYEQLTDGELAALTEVWQEQRVELESTEALQTFQAQLHRRWAIETGIIEGAYSLDRGVTETLIQNGIDANLIPSSNSKDPELVAAMIEDHLHVLEGLFEYVKGGRELTTSYVKELHAALLRHVKTHTVRDSAGNLFEKELVKGAYKTQPNNPSRPDGSVHEYCPPEHVASEMDNLIRLHQEHTNRGVPPEIASAWLHHAFTQIHPFADGNGRVARAIATAVFIKAGLFPLLMTRDDRNYIPALEQADAGDLSPAIRLFIANQRQAVIDAVHSIPPTGLQTEPRTVEDQIQAARVKMLASGDVYFPKEEWNIARRSSGQMGDVAMRRFVELAALLASQLGSKTWRFSASASGITLERRDPHGVIDITFRTTDAGNPIRGILSSKIIYQRDGQVPLSLTEPFQTNYKESVDSIRSRFTPWFEAGLSRGLALWREQL